MAGTLKMAVVVALTLLPALSRSQNCGWMGMTYNGSYCPLQQCCSGAGFCGNGSEYCTMPGNCQSNFGRCVSDDYPSKPDTGKGPRPLYGSVSYDNAITSCTKPRTIALTFDDGPENYTNQLLDLLHLANIPSTFFVAGNINGRGRIDDSTTVYPDTLRRMLRDGHQIGSHTWTHPNLDNLTSNNRIATMVKLESALSNVIGRYPAYMRPPYGMCNTTTCRNDIKKLGYHVIESDLVSRDTDFTNNLTQSKIIIKNALQSRDPFNGSALILMHDRLPGVVELTAYIIAQVQTSLPTWNFATVGECLEDPMANWYRQGSEGKQTSGASRLRIW